MPQEDRRASQQASGKSFSLGRYSCTERGYHGWWYLHPWRFSAFSKGTADLIKNWLCVGVREGSPKISLPNDTSAILHHVINEAWDQERLKIKLNIE